MPLNLISEQPLIFLVWVLAILIALSVHEFAHALVAHLLGDETAKYQGRLTLNPIAHIDTMGFLMLLLIGFGWGKPVPMNPYNLRFGRWGPTIVALAGPGANLINTFLFGIALKVLLIIGLTLDNLLIQFLALLIVINLTLLLFNLIPIPPLDGSKVLFSILAAPKYNHVRLLLETRGPMVLIFLIILDNLFGLNIFGNLFGGIIRFVYTFF